MANFFSVSSGTCLATQAAYYILAQTSGASRAKAVVFVPTRRAAVAMRRAFEEVLGDETSLL